MVPSGPRLSPGSGAQRPLARTPRAARRGGSAHSAVPPRGTENPAERSPPGSLRRPCPYSELGCERGAPGRRAARRGAGPGPSPHSPQPPSAAPRGASPVAPTRPEGPGAVAKAPYLRPIRVLNSELGLVPRSPPASSSRQLKKPGAPGSGWRLASAEEGSRAGGAEARGGREPSCLRAGHAQCAARGGARGALHLPGPALGWRPPAALVKLVKGARS